MRHVPAIAGRELSGLFSTPVAYVLIASFVLFGGFIFFGSLGFFLLQVQQIQAMGMTQYLAQVNLNDVVIAPAFGTFALILMFMVPMLSMRAFAEERATGSIELLLTSPISSWEIVIGKYLAIICVVTLVIALSALFPGMLFLYGEPEPWQTLSGLTMLFLDAASLVAMSCFISVLTSSQLVAAFVAFIAALLLYVLPFAAESSQNEAFKSALTWLGSSTHFERGLRGEVRLQDLTYFAVSIVVFLSLARAATESLRWR